MIDIIFSLVLYKHSISDISPLLDSVSRLCSSSPKFRVRLLIYDGSPKAITYCDSSNVSTYLPDRSFEYYKGFNVGYGSGHNYNFSRIVSADPFYFFVVNPDISFEPHSIRNMIEYCLVYPNIACMAPLVLLPNGKIQHSAKRNVTFISLLLGRFSFLKFFSLASRYDSYHKNLHFDYARETFNSPYLSGCFLLIPSNFYKLVSGFDSRFFLHLEDADIVRRLSMHGKTVHFHQSSIVHLWARGSHSSIRQMLYVLKSYLVYVRKWGFCLF